MKGQELWDKYTHYKNQMFSKTHSSFSPWIIVKTNNKRIQSFLKNQKWYGKEVQQLMPESIKLLSLADINCNEEILETAATLLGNAQIKADYVTQTYGFDCFADDTGLETSFRFQSWRKMPKA